MSKQTITKTENTTVPLLVTLSDWSGGTEKVILNHILVDNYERANYNRSMGIDVTNGLSVSDAKALLPEGTYLKPKPHFSHFMWPIHDAFSRVHMGSAVSETRTYLSEADLRDKRFSCDHFMPRFGVSSHSGVKATYGLKDLCESLQAFVESRPPNSNNVKTDLVVVADITSTRPGSTDAAGGTTLSFVVRLLEEESIGKVKLLDK